MLVMFSGPHNVEAVFTYFYIFFLCPTSYMQLTYADFYLYTAMEVILKQTPTLLDKFPTLKKQHASVEALPNIAKWLKERPETPF